MSFGNNIKKLRRNANLTQEQLAELLLISPQAVSRWETDAAMPDISLLPALANTFHVTTDSLLDVDIENNEANIEELCKNIIDFKNGDTFKVKIAKFRDAMRNNPTNIKLKEHYAMLLYMYRMTNENRNDPELNDEIYQLCLSLVRSKDPGIDQAYFIELMSFVKKDEDAEKNAQIKELIDSGVHLKNSIESILPHCTVGAERVSANKNLLFACSIEMANAIYELYKDIDILTECEIDALENARHFLDAVYGHNTATWMLDVETLIPYFCALCYMQKYGQAISMIEEAVRHLSHISNLEEFSYNPLIPTDNTLVKAYSSKKIVKEQIKGSARELVKAINNNLPQSEMERIDIQTALAELQEIATSNTANFSNEHSINAVIDALSSKLNS